MLYFNDGKTQTLYMWTVQSFIWRLNFMVQFLFAVLKIVSKTIQDYPLVSVISMSSVRHWLSHCRCYQGNRAVMSRMDCSVNTGVLWKCLIFFNRHMAILHYILSFYLSIFPIKLCLKCGSWSEGGKHLKGSIGQCAYRWIVTSGNNFSYYNNNCL